MKNDAPISADDRLLRRYWLTFKDTTSHAYSREYGVTAYDYDDAVHLLREKVFRDDVPKPLSVEEDVDVSALDERHVLPNIAPTNWRGVWYPVGFAETRNRTRPRIPDSSMAPPIVVDETGALMVFESRRAAERYLEWIDVEDGRFRAWDSEGRPLVLSVVATPERRLFRTRMVKTVVLEPLGDVPTHAEVLRTVLSKALTQAGKEPGSSETGLDELIEEARRWFRVSDRS